MLKTFRRPFLTALFLLALLAFNSLWALVGGQYHLDLMFWAWKLGLSLLAASLIVILATGSRRRVWIAGLLLAATLATAGAVTYYYHVNEPADDEDNQTDQLTRLTSTKAKTDLRRR
ncbi:MAG TPA: hypothetical protein VNH18_23585 [Bryobacteraceae bacterium]|nr:hypothetical protein [Bryobacteraceae bacterium]